MLCLSRNSPFRRRSKLTDPHRFGKQYGKTVYRDDQRNRFVTYLEWRSSRGTFDFDLRASFRIDPHAFGTYRYTDHHTDAYGLHYDEYKRFLPREQTNSIQQFFAEKIVMGDQYSAGQAGAMGPHSKVSNMTFQQIWQQTQSSIDLETPSGELAPLRRAMRHAAEELSHDKAVAEVGAAEEAAQNGDGSLVLQHLKNAGKWALDVATKIGVSVASEALKKSLGS